MRLKICKTLITIRPNSEFSGSYEKREKQENYFWNTW